MNCSGILASEGSKLTSMQNMEAKKNSVYSKIEIALELNKQCDESFQHLEEILEQRLIECREKLHKVQSQNISYEDRQESFRYINCGRPYFKDKNNFAAPDNNDTLVMAKNGMFDFSTVSTVPGWTMRDKTQLWKQIEKNTKHMKAIKLRSKITALRRESKQKHSVEKEAIEQKIARIKKKLVKLSTKTLHKLALPIDEEYDWEEITHCLNRRHSAQEYRALWKLYLHPSINKSRWNKAEHQLLQKIAYENNLCGWEQIAEQMGNNRTGYQCFVYFCTNMNSTFTGKKWGSEEVSYLLRLIEYYREDNYIPWFKVAGLMENRTKIQIYTKYTRLLEQRKGRFLLEEDAVILTCADDFGPDFKRIAEFLPGRSISQIRVRYQVLMKKRTSTVWTVEEDRKLFQLLAGRDSSTNYASVSKYFPGKDRIHIRARYVTLIKWMRKNPNVDITKAPRRGARRLGHGKASENLSVAIDSLKARIEIEAQMERNSTFNIDSTEESIENGIIAALMYENIHYNESGICDVCGSDDQSIHKNLDPTINEMNQGNLQRILLMLRASLNKKYFEKCQCNSSSKLNKADEGTVKIQSKQNKIQTIELNEAPDIWGHNTLKLPQYVLPPHYATIIGLRNLMSYVASNKRKHILPDLSIFRQKNVISQLDIFMERFNTLFLWPMLLSKAEPNLENIK